MSRIHTVSFEDLSLVKKKIQILSGMSIRINTNYSSCLYSTVSLALLTLSFVYLFSLCLSYFLFQTVLDHEC